MDHPRGVLELACLSAKEISSFIMNRAHIAADMALFAESVSGAG